MGNIRSNMWSTNAHSILTQEKETEEHVKYQQLLEQVVPCLYGTTEGANARSSAKPAFSFNAPQRRGTLHDNSNKQKPITNQRQSLTLQDSYIRALKRPPLSSTINLDDDDDDDEDEVEDEDEDEENNEDVTFLGVQQRHPVRNNLSTVIIDDDDEISEIIDLDDDEQQVVSACTKLNDQNASGITTGTTYKKKSAMRL